MSFFYLTPTKGNLQIHVLEVIIKKRLEHLHTVLHNKTINYNEYVIEGSVYDNVGHFILCLAAICEKNSDFYNFVLTAEEALFRRRLESLSVYDIRCFARRLLKVIRKIDVYNMQLRALQVSCQYLSLKHYAHHITSQCGELCSLYYMKLKFYQCLELLSKRQVEISNGIVQVPCNKWKEYLIILFKNNVKHRLYKTHLNNLSCDPRITDILKSLDNTLLFWKKPSRDIFTSLNVDEKSNLFPPCMLNLHLQLREKHRLSHEQRFNYSLFLKDIGMLVHEAVEFWKLEYSRSAKRHNCSHNWAKDEKKFLYGIRHMYGLEGGRKSYACRNCYHIQAEKSTSEGGCPFKVFGVRQLEKLLVLDESDPLMSQINELRNKNQYTKACLWYLKNYHKPTTDFKNVSLDLTPVKYFILTSTK